MSSLVFVPGWGLDADFWQPVQNLLGGVVWEPCLSCPIEKTSRSYPFPKKPVIGVGHSWGFAWLLHYFPGQWQGLVSINGFTRFTRAPGFPEGIAPRVLQRMIDRFSQDPAGVHSEFLRRCGEYSSRSTLKDLRELLPGLHALQEWDERETLRTHKIPVLALAGLQDAIVSPNLSKKCFANVEIKWQSGGHLLPRTHSAWCAAQIQEFAERII